MQCLALLQDCSAPKDGPNMMTAAEVRMTVAC